VRSQLEGFDGKVLAIVVRGRVAVGSVAQPSLGLIAGQEPMTPGQSKYLVEHQAIDLARRRYMGLEGATQQLSRGLERDIETFDGCIPEEIEAHRGRIGRFRLEGLERLPQGLGGANQVVDVKAHGSDRSVEGLDGPL
jgi:hypothetical protein